MAKQGEQDRSRDNNPDRNVIPATATEIGVSPKEIHAGRRLKAAEENDPEVIVRRINEMVEAGQEPTKAALKHKLKQMPKPPGPDRSARKCAARPATSSPIPHESFALRLVTRPAWVRVRIWRGQCGPPTEASKMVCLRMQDGTWGAAAANSSRLPVSTADPSPRRAPPMETKVKTLMLSAATALALTGAAVADDDNTCLGAQNIAEAAHERRAEYSREIVYLRAVMSLADAQPSPEQQAYFDRNLPVIIALAFESSISAKHFWARGLEKLRRRGGLTVVDLAAPFHAGADAAPRWELIDLSLK